MEYVLYGGFLLQATAGAERRHAYGVSIKASMKPDGGRLQLQFEIYNAN